LFKKLKKIDFEKLKSIKSFSVLIVPDDSGIKAKTQKLSPQKIIWLVVFYSVIVFIFSYLVMAFTPVGDLFKIKGNTLSEEDMTQVQELNKKLIFLAHELEDMRSKNDRLRYALILGDSTLADSLVQTDSSDSEAGKLNLKKKAGGDILSVINDLFFKHNLHQGKEFTFSRPVNGFISRQFEPENGHFGIDYVVKTGTPVYAASGGYVVFSGFTVEDGYMLIINSPDNYITVYKHLSALLKKEREIVSQGELIALTGNTGDVTTGPHLHFEIWKNGQPINPKFVLINY